MAVFFLAVPWREASYAVPPSRECRLVPRAPLGTVAACPPAKGPARSASPALPGAREGGLAGGRTAMNSVLLQEDKQPGREKQTRSFLCSRLRRGEVLRLLGHRVPRWPFCALLHGPDLGSPSFCAVIFLTAEGFYGQLIQNRGSSQQNGVCREVYRREECAVASDVPGFALPMTPAPPLTVSPCSILGLTAPQPAGRETCIS